MKNIIIPNWITYALLFISAFLFVFLFSCTTSPFYEHYHFWYHGDSGFFQEMGICLAQGGTPYMDLFDHKGPFLWFIEALGISLSTYWGLMALQIIALFFSIILWYKSALLILDKPIGAFSITIIGLLFLLAFYERGNLCEEWCLPFISIPIYLYLKRLKNSTDCTAFIYNHHDTFIIGLSVGIIAMIRLNNTGPVVSFVLWHFLLCIHHKEFKRVLVDIALICCGISIVFILCSSYYFIKAGWTGVYEMIYGNFIFNFDYYNSINDINNTHFYEYKHIYLAPIIFGFITIICFFYNKKSTGISIPVFISYIISLFAIGYSIFFHYIIIFVPLLVLTTSLIFLTKARLTYFVWMVMIVFLIRTIHDPVDLLAFRLMGKQADNEIYDGFHRFISTMPPDERKSIYNAGLSPTLGATFFSEENIYQCNRLILSRHQDYSQHLRDYEATHGIKDMKPVWVLIQSPRPIATDDYILTHYTLTDSITGGLYDPIWCWKETSTL